MNFFKYRIFTSILKVQRKNFIIFLVCLFQWRHQIAIKMIFWLQVYKWQHQLGIFFFIFLVSPPSMEAPNVSNKIFLVTGL